jgi:hypothetical protein
MESKMADSQDTPNETELQAARAVLLVLGAIVEDGETVESVRIAGFPPSGVEQAAQYLASIRKPVRCGAHVWDGVLVVSHFPFFGTHEYPGIRYSPWPPSDTRTPLGGDGEPRVLLRGSVHEMILQRGTLETAREAYVIDGLRSVAGNPPSSGEAEQGITWVIEVGAPVAGISTTNVDDLNLEEPLRSIIQAEFERVKREGANAFREMM